jgi:hypothetical protein
MAINVRVFSLYSLTTRGYTSYLLIMFVELCHEFERNMTREQSFKPEAKEN